MDLLQEKSAPPTTSATASNDPPLASLAAAGPASLSLATAISAPNWATPSSFVRPATATTRAPRRLANWISAEPTPPDAPVMAIDCPSLSPTRCNMCSAVDQEHAKLANSTSLSPVSIGCTLRAGTAQYSANPPSRSLPRYPANSRCPWHRCCGRYHEQAALMRVAAPDRSSAACAGDRRWPNSLIRSPWVSMGETPASAMPSYRAANACFLRT